MTLEFKQYLLKEFVRDSLLRRDVANHQGSIGAGERSLRDHDWPAAPEKVVTLDNPWDAVPLARLG
jgi:hypothetical protein